MKRNCYECGKRITFWRSRFHPVLGKDILICPECFERVQTSLENYRNFILNEIVHNNKSKPTDFSKIKTDLSNWWHQIHNHL